MRRYHQRCRATNPNNICLFFRSKMGSVDENLYTTDSLTILS